MANQALTTISAVVTAALTTLTLAPSVQADPLPPVRLGLWRVTRTLTMPARPAMVSRVCIDACRLSAY